MANVRSGKARMKKKNFKNSRTFSAKLTTYLPDKRSSLQVGFNGGVGEFEAGADFGVYVMGIGNRTTPADPLGMGSVTVNNGVIVADGEGVERDLDLNRIASSPMTFPTARPVPTAGTRSTGGASSIPGPG